MKWPFFGINTRIRRLQPGVQTGICPFMQKNRPFRAEIFQDCPDWV